MYFFCIHRNPPLQREGKLKGVITTIESVSCRVDTERGEYICTARGKLTDSDTGEKKPLAVGDRVTVEETSGSDRQAVITGVLPRRTHLSRSHPGNPRLEQIIAANVDQAMIVGSVNSPPLTPGIIDRYVISAESGGIVPVICINKTDLAGKTDRHYIDVAGIYESAGYRVLLTSAKSEAGLENLKKTLEGKTTVVAGHSGVGKSSLINAIQPGIELKTAPLGWKGTHCTAKATLLKLDFGGYVVDTPGIRELQPWDIEKHEVQQFFPEIWQRAQQCRMPDCTHLHEPDCAVKSAAESGQIPQMRYSSYAGIVAALVPSLKQRHDESSAHETRFKKNAKKSGRRARKRELDRMIDEYRDE